MAKPNLEHISSIFSILSELVRFGLNNARFPHSFLECVCLAEMQVDVHGIPELQLKLARLDQNVRSNVDDALNFEVEAIKAQAQSLAPRRTGYLASTIFVERVGRWAFKLGARAAYAFFVEFGTRFMQGRRFLSRALELSLPGLVRHVNDAIREAIAEASSAS